MPEPDPTVRVVNILNGDPYDIYIGRANRSYNLPASPFANPFLNGVDGDREDILDKYERYVRSRPDLLARLPELEGKTLGCWCLPEMCHGHVLARLVAERSARRWPLAPARTLAEAIASRLVERGAVERVAVAGSIRRGKPEVKDIELVVVPTIVPTQRDLFGQPVGWQNLLDVLVGELLADGIVGHRLDVLGRQAAGERYKRLVWQHGPLAGIGLDLFSVLPPSEYGLQLVIRTGPADFSQRLVTPRDRGGLLPAGHRVLDGAIWQTNDLGAPTRAVPTPDEADLFAFLGLDVIRPEDRR